MTIPRIYSTPEERAHARRIQNRLAQRRFQAKWRAERERVAERAKVRAAERAKLRAAERANTEGQPDA